jgi:Trk K+ transport system NAD-binding subunit
LTVTASHRVCVLWRLDAERAAAFRALGADVVMRDPDTDAALYDVGVMHATVLLALSNDDGLNLATALRARLLNPAIRIVIRQLSVSLGAKLERLLPDCTTLSLAAHSAATYAAAALDGGCFFAFRFPEGTGPLVGFSRRNAHEAGVAGLTIAAAEARLGARILALENRRDPPPGAVVGSDEKLIIFATVAEDATNLAVAPAEESGSAERAPAEPLRSRIANAYRRTNPILRGVGVAAVVFLIAAVVFFRFALGASWPAAAFYVAQILTNAGFGDVAVTRRGVFAVVGTIVAMIGGILFTSVFVGAIASSLTRAQWIAVQGMRRIRARKHVVVCGGGKIGSAVITYLTTHGKRVVVIEPHPDADLLRRAQDGDIDLLTGDASRDGALDMCDLAHATAVIALTNSDTVNLEIALAVRARSRNVRLVVRMEDAGFARSTAQLLGIATFSPSGLTAPVFAGLSRFPGARGRIRFAHEYFAIRQSTHDATAEPPRDAMPLCVARNGRLHLLDDFAKALPHDLVVFVEPLAHRAPTLDAPPTAAP